MPIMSNNISNRRNTGISAGSSSILVIFVLLCLTTFATLSLVSARADYKLAERTALATQDYYKADAIAEETLSELAQVLQNSLRQATNVQEYASSLSQIADGRDNFFTVQNKENVVEISYVVSVDDRRELQVSVESDYKSAKEGKLYNLTKWKTAPTQDWQESEDGIKLWSGSADS